jgi:hypothetical protein
LLGESGFGFDGMGDSEGAFPDATVAFHLPASAIRFAGFGPLLVALVSSGSGRFLGEKRDVDAVGAADDDGGGSGLLGGCVDGGGSIAGGGREAWGVGGAVDVNFGVNVKFIVSFSCAGGGIKGLAAGALPRGGGGLNT